MKTILCFAAHPDDLEFACTGTLHKFLKNGYEAIFVILTNGENGFKAKSDSREERVETRKKEQLEVAKKMGLKDVIFLDKKDGFLEYDENLRRSLVQIIKKYRPEIIFSFDPANNEFDSLNLFHRDHRTAAIAVFDACFAAKNNLMYPGSQHKVEKIYFFATNKPNHFEDISDLIEFKLELLRCHKSQFPDFVKVEKYLKERVSVSHGSYQYCEAFRVIEVRQLT